MIRKDSRSFSTGGVILLLLPVFVFSYSMRSVSFASNITNNINEFNQSSAGQITSLKPYFLYDGFLIFIYNGDLSVINFNATDLFVTNDVQLAKNILLPGVGNKTIAYTKFYTFYTPSYDLYNNIDIECGDRLDFYFDNLLFSSDVNVSYKHYYSDDIMSYLEPRLNTHLRVPIPYAFLTPQFASGARIYGNEFVPFYTAATQLHFPLTMDFSVSSQFTFHHVMQPESEYITSPEYADDPFFEKVNLNQMYDLDIIITKTFIKQRASVETHLNLFHKNFYEIEGIGRTDGGLQVDLQYKRLLTSQLDFSVRASTWMNSSTVDDFDFVKSDLELIFELLF